MDRIRSSLAKNKVYLLSLILSVAAALVIGAVLMVVTGFDPADGYGAMIKGALGSPRVFGNTITKMITLCLTGLAMTIGAKAGMFNVGGEGQLFLGGLAATMTGIGLQGGKSAHSRATGIFVGCGCGRDICPDTCRAQGEAQGKRSDNYHHVKLCGHICMLLSCKQQRASGHRRFRSPWRQ